MLIGIRSAQWLHTSALITHIRLAAGDKNAKPENFNPYSDVDHVDQRAKFKDLIRGKN